MIVNYLANVLGKEPDLLKDCSAFAASIQEETRELQNYMTLACQYEIMGIHTDNTPLIDFMPNQIVSRAEFGTVLSRLLRGDTYNDSDPYYLKHLQALKKAGIMTQIDSPLEWQEQRKRAWLMLMRSATDRTSIIPDRPSITEEPKTPSSSWTTTPSVVPSSYPWATALNLVDPTLGAQQLGTNLTRGRLAQIVVSYATNVLHRQIPDKIPTYCYFKDGSNARSTPQEKVYAIQSCQIGLMGLSMDYYQPRTEVTQAQLAIVLYRLLYDPSYVGKQAPRKLPLDTLIADGLLQPTATPQTSVVTIEQTLSLLMKAF